MEDVAEKKRRRRERRGQRQRAAERLLRRRRVPQQELGDAGTQMERWIAGFGDHGGREGVRRLLMASIPDRFPSGLSLDMSLGARYPLRRGVRREQQRNQRR